MAIFLSCAPSPALRSIEVVENAGFGTDRFAFWLNHEVDDPVRWVFEYHRLPEVFESLLDRVNLEVPVMQDDSRTEWTLFLHYYDDHVTIGCKRETVNGDIAELVSLGEAEVDRTTARIMELMESHGYNRELVL